MNFNPSSAPREGRFVGFRVHYRFVPNQGGDGTFDRTIISAPYVVPSLEERERPLLNSMVLRYS